MDEIWKPVKGYEQYFDVSSHGRIFSKRTNKILKFQISPNGYYEFCTRFNGKCKTLKVHRLVALTFIENTNEKLVVNHKDGNKLNNNYNNLEWCTQQYNTKHAVDTGLFVPAKGEKHCCSTITEDIVRKIRQMHVPNKIGKTKIARELGLKTRHVASILLGESWNHVI